MGLVVLAGQAQVVCAQGMLQSAEQAPTEGLAQGLDGQQEFAPGVVPGGGGVEADETFSLAISFANPPPVGASITTASASVVIRNDDFPDDYSADATTTTAKTRFAAIWASL